MGVRVQVPPSARNPLCLITLGIFYFYDMATVYVLYSKEMNRYYTGSCLDFSKRFKQHLDQAFNDAFTRKASDWKLYLRIDDLDYNQARKIEAHIKSMKSRKYIENLKKYPEMLSSLKERYDAGSSR